MKVFKLLFKKKRGIISLFIVILGTMVLSCQNGQQDSSGHQYNGWYEGAYTKNVAFPIGGIGAGMFTLDGTGCLSHFSLRNKPDIYNEPVEFAAIHVKGVENGSKILEGPVPEDKIFSSSGTGNGAAGRSYGLPRFESSRFLARFPFGKVQLEDQDIPMDVSISGWSPFTPNDPDNSSLPVGALEYSFKNNTDSTLETVFSYHSRNFMSMGNEGGDSIMSYPNGFRLHQSANEENPQHLGDFVAFIKGENVTSDLSWFRGGWWDALTILWKNIEEGNIVSNPSKEDAPGASIYKPITLEPGEEKTVQLLMAWYVPNTQIRIGRSPESGNPEEGTGSSGQECCSEGESCSGAESLISGGEYYKPWYSAEYNSIKDIAEYWNNNYNQLKEQSTLFKNSFYASSLPDVVMEAISANLTILKSPTVLRTSTGTFWAWEGSSDNFGCCHGTCTHVWNYAQAIPHLFPSLERSLRETEFFVDQNKEGHQKFRTNLPIRPPYHEFHSATDGQLGGIMKVYREWRISGNTEWLKELWPKVKQSFEYCSNTWDPKEKGYLEEPQHNTYDIEFWGPNGMLTSFYLGAMQAMIEMGDALGEDVSKYENLYEKGKQYMETELYNGEYFIQKIQVEGLRAKNPVEGSEKGIRMNYSPEAIELLKKEGPKYQYGNGVISDGVLGAWIGRMSGLEEFIDQEKIESHLSAVHKYNLKEDLYDHVNPQRPAFAQGHEGGLLLCSWPKGERLSLPFVYSDEVWTGIEYQVASHLMLQGEVDKGLDIVKATRNRYDGTIRNPFNEYECGHWYARAMASYGLLQGLTGIRYDAVDKTLYIDSKIGDDFTSFLSTATGYGNVGLEGGEPFVDVKQGEIPVENIIVSGEKVQ